MQQLPVEIIQQIFRYFLLPLLLPLRLTSRQLQRAVQDFFLRYLLQGPELYVLCRISARDPLLTLQCAKSFPLTGLFDYQLVLESPVLPIGRRSLHMYDLHGELMYVRAAGMVTWVPFIPIKSIVEVPGQGPLRAIHKRTRVVWIRKVEEAEVGIRVIYSQLKLFGNWFIKQRSPTPPCNTTTATATATTTPTNAMTNANNNCGSGDGDKGEMARIVLSGCTLNVWQLCDVLPTGIREIMLTILKRQGKV